MNRGSRIFERYKALGYVSNNIPLVVRYIKMRNENLVVTVIGNCFHTYGCDRFSLLSVSDVHHRDITCLAGDTYHIYTSCGTEVYAWRRGTELKHTYKGHKKPVHIILPLCDTLLTVDEESIVKVWDIKTEDLLLEFPFCNDNFQVTRVLHPSTYLNKILLASKQGQLKLLNIHTSKIIYTFCGWNSEITALQQAPAVDVVAVGLANGKILLHNLKYDETVIDFTQDCGLVTSISFRTDGVPIMISGSETGHITLWNLEEKRSSSQIEYAHNDAVTGMECLPSEPLMVTSSPDNSLKLWIFDMPDGGARLLRLREGHSSPPTYIRYHGNNGRNILSAGGDSSLRVFSAVTEMCNKSLGVAYYDRKVAKKVGKEERKQLRMPPIIKFTSETSREEEWDDLATIHHGLDIVTTWSYKKSRMGNFKLIPDSLKNKTSRSPNLITATCICLTHCGNFVIIGYSCGEIHKFNIQSGIHRGMYGNPTAHTGAVRGITSDLLNQVVVSGGSDSIIKFWPFKTGGNKILSKVALEESVIFFHIHRESSLLAVALEDYQVVVIDMDTRIVIRKFCGHSAQLTDMAWSPDARWLVTASMDCSIQTWDIPSAHLVDFLQVDSPCTSLTFSPTGDRLATAHVNHLGIFLWSNRTLFENILLRPIFQPSAVPVSVLPTPADVLVTLDESDEEHDTEHFKSPQQISEDLVTLSLFSSSRWQNLLNIDIIQKRNKPTEPFKKPKDAPFFLPTIPSLDFRFDLSEKTSSDDKINKSMQLRGLTPFGKLLHHTIMSGQFKDAVQKLKELGPSAINFEIESLGFEGGSHELVLQFMKLLETMLSSNQDFELAQSYLGLFLKKHGNFVISNPELFAQLLLLQNSQSESWKTLQDKLMYSLCVIGSLKSM